MRKFATVAGAVFCMLFFSCEKGSSKNNGDFDWDILNDQDHATSDTNPNDDTAGDDGETFDEDGNSDEQEDEGDGQPATDGDIATSDKDAPSDIDGLAEADSLSDSKTDIDDANDEEGDDASDEESDAMIDDADVGINDSLANDLDESTATNHKPIADAGTDRTALIGYPVMVDGSASYDFDQDTLTYTWTIVSEPAGSAIALDLDDPEKPKFEPQIKGVYTLRLTVNDGKENSAPDEISINVADYVPINFEVVDSAYSKTIDSIIFVSEEPKNTLYIFDIEARTIASIQLPLIPRSLSISPDGTRAVVGHDGWFTVIDLEEKTLVEGFVAKTVVYDIVFGTDDRVYVFPDISKDLLIFDAVTGDIIGEVKDFGNALRAVSYPSANRLFYIHDGKINLMDISVLPPEQLGSLDSIFPIGTDLWMAENGTKIFTQAGSVFYAYDLGGPDEDLIYMGRLEELKEVKHLHNLGAVGRTVAIPKEPDDIQLNLYSDPYLEYEKTITLPRINLNDNEYQYHGEVVYFNKDDTKIVAVITTKIGVIENYALAIIENF